MRARPGRHGDNHHINERLNSLLLATLVGLVGWLGTVANTRMDRMEANQFDMKADISWIKGHLERTDERNRPLLFIPPPDAKITANRENPPAL